MRRGLLKNYADTLCDIFAGWRLHVSPGDMTLLIGVGKGSLDIDLLDGATNLDGHPVSFTFGNELRDWLRERSDKDGLGWVNVSRATLTAQFSFSETAMPAKRRWWQPRASVRRYRELCLDCEAQIESTAGEATSRKTFHEVGIKVGDGPWVVY